MFEYFIKSGLFLLIPLLFFMILYFFKINISIILYFIIFYLIIIIAYIAINKKKYKKYYILINKKTDLKNIDYCPKYCKYNINENCKYCVNKYDNSILVNNY